MRRIVLAVVLAGTVIVAGCAGGGIEVPESGEAGDADEAASGVDAEVAGELEIHHIDVGQADSTLIRAPNGETVLIDSGGWQSDGAEVIEYLDARGIGRIDHLIATHGHADHVGGHAAIIEAFEADRDGIGAIYDSGVTHTSQTYENYLDAVEASGNELLVVESGDELPIGGDNVSALVVNPPAGGGEDLHGASVAVVFEFGDVRYLTTGDAEAEAESRMVETWGEDLDVDVYQAGHHGSSTSSSGALLDAASPDVAVVSSARDSQYGHPHDETLEAFAERGVDTYWTGVHGDVVITTDGSEVGVRTADPFSEDPTELLEAAQSAEDPSAATASAGGPDRRGNGGGG